MTDSSKSVWFVTGCSSGVGKSLATIIQGAGHRVVATARNESTLSYLPGGPNVLKLALDITSKDAISKSLSTAVERFGRIDVVINNAGYALMGDTEMITEADARLEMETLFWGPVFITREAVRIFREVNPAGHGGTVVQVSSIGGYVTYPGSAFYNAGKYALGGFTESFAKEIDPSWGIKLMVVAPGGVKSNFRHNVHFGNRHPAYDTPKAPFNQLIEAMKNPAILDSFTEADDCAKVLFDTVVDQDRRALPQRLLMGADAFSVLQAEHKRVLEEMDNWKDVTLRCSAKTGTEEVPISS